MLMMLLDELRITADATSDIIIYIANKGTCIYSWMNEITHAWVAAVWRP